MVQKCRCTAVQRWWSRGAEQVQSRCRGGAVVMQWFCIGGAAEVVQRWCSGGTEVLIWRC